MWSVLSTSYIVINIYAEIDLLLNDAGEDLLYIY